MTAAAAPVKTADRHAPAGSIAILISDKVAPECLALFEREQAARGARPLQVDYKPGQKRDDLLAAIGRYEGLIVRSETEVDAALIARAERLRAVVRAGVGVDNIDLAAATERGVLVMNCPAGNTVAAAEHTIAMMCALARNLPQAHAALKAGRWERSKFMGTELAQKTLGVVGLGKVGREVARRARGLGLKVLGYDPFVPIEAAQSLEVDVAPLDEVVRRADFLTLHVPLTEGTKNLLSADRMRLMKPGARIINVARGGIVDEGALAQAIREGRLAGAALDVFAKEPVEADNPLLALEQVIVTPHLGASTKEAQEAVGIESARQLIDYLRDGLTVNAVNTVALDPALVRRMRPWRDLAEKLGSLQGQLREGAVRRVGLQFAGELFGRDERRLLSLAFLQGFLSRYIDTPVNHVNAHLFAKQHGVDIREEQTASTGGYLNLITAEVETSGPSAHAIRIRRIAGTVFGESHLRIVQLDGYMTDALPRGDMLIVSNNDTPGIIGIIGTTLGQSGVNIASMSVGRDTTGGTAVAILNVDSPVPEALQQELSARPGMIWVKAVRL